MAALHKTPYTATHRGEGWEIPCRLLLCIFDCSVRYDWLRNDLKLGGADGLPRVDPNHDVVIQTAAVFRKEPPDVRQVRNLYRQSW